MAGTIVVENTEARIHSIADLPLKPGTQFPDALMPGVNEVDVDAWNRAMKIPVVQHLVRAGVLKPEPGKKADVTQLEDDDAVSMIAKTVDRSLLEKWQGREKRPKVRDALAAQILAITPKPPKDGAGDDQ